jgi:hypothetical protein
MSDAHNYAPMGIAVHIILLTDVQNLLVFLLFSCISEENVLVLLYLRRPPGV